MIESSFAAPPPAAGGRETISIGLAIAGGTGDELGDAFRAAIASLAERHGRPVDIVTWPHRARTYGDLARDEVSPTEAAAIAEQDAAAYLDWLREQFRGGMRAVFRTAFNAQSIYLAREALWGVKPEAFVHPGGDLLVVRDGTQGFYAGRNSHPLSGADRIERVCEFTRDRTHRVLDFAREEAVARWGSDRIDRLVVAYKFHLLDRRFEEWVRDYGHSREVDVELYQPDTANRNFARGLFDGRVVLVGANEWADVMHTELVARFGLGSQDERCSRNVYLAEEVAGLEEYQTVHGSADDIAGEERVNPVATLRAAAALLERHARCEGAVDRMEAALRRVALDGLSTPDLGGRARTSEVTTAALEAYAEERPGPRRSGRLEADALIVVDLQNDFCAPDGHFARQGLVDPAVTGEVADRIERLVASARADGIEAIFVRMVADPANALAVVAERNRREGRTGIIAPDGAGSAFFRVHPLPGELVITKSGYDPFLVPELEAHLRRRGVATLTVVGAFADVCVDATARTAYQKGFRVRVLEDCTSALERPTADALSYMARYYGAEIASSAEWPRASELSNDADPLLHAVES